MQSLRKTTGYALLSLSYLAERPGVCASAREIAGAFQLPLPQLMKILKVLHQKGLLLSTRGVKGGYQIGRDLRTVSLYDLMLMLEAGLRGTPSDIFRAQPRRSWLAIDGRSEAPLLALQYKLNDFFESVKLWDLVLPGRRIDVPVEQLRQCKTNPMRRAEPTAVAAS